MCPVHKLTYLSMLIHRRDREIKEHSVSVEQRQKATIQIFSSEGNIHLIFFAFVYLISGRGDLFLVYFFGVHN